MKNKPHTLKWFQNRIGKRIFRDPVSCPCPACFEVGQKGKVVRNKQDAEYLYHIQNDLHIIYRDNE